MAAVCKTANAAAVISALATASHIRAGARQSHRVLQSVILGGFHELIWCIAEVRREAIAHVVRMSLPRVMVHGGNRVVQRGRSSVCGIWRVLVLLFTIKAYYKTHLLNVLSRSIIERVRGAPQALATITAVTYVLRTFSSG